MKMLILYLVPYHLSILWLVFFRIKKDFDVSIVKFSRGGRVKYVCFSSTSFVNLQNSTFMGLVIDLDPLAVHNTTFIRHCERLDLLGIYIYIYIYTCSMSGSGRDISVTVVKFVFL